MDDISVHSSALGFAAYNVPASCVDGPAWQEIIWRAAQRSLAVMCGWPPPGKRSFGVQHRGRLQSCVDGPRLARDHLACSAEVACSHVWMAPAWQEIIWRAAQRSLAVMCPACWCSPGGLLALMGCANRVLIIQTGSMSR